MKTLRRFTPKTCITLVASLILSVFTINAQTILDSDTQSFRVAGYLRTGLGGSEGGDVMATFQIPGALNKFSLGNQADTYGEVEFDYRYFIDKESGKSIDAIWMVSYFERFGSEYAMFFHRAEQLYFRFNNLFNHGETIWAGKRFYNRRAIYMLDRQWLNPGQGGIGLGVENLFNISGSKEDIRFGVWQFRNKNVTSAYNGEVGTIYNYNFDIRWIHHPICENLNINAAINVAYRQRNFDLGYDGAWGFGAFGWIDYENGNITNTTALLFRQGATQPINHWTGKSDIENPLNNNIILNDLSKSYTVELNSEFLYDNKETFAINATFVGAIRNYGTTPHYAYTSTISLENIYDSESVEGYSDGKMFYWLALGVRPTYYLAKNFRLTAEVTQEFVNNRQLGVGGNMTRFTFSPELALSKGYFARPILRPAVSYARWNSGLEGYIGGDVYNDTTHGFTYSLQFEIWW
ncbi:MAG: carbohydrate porin [Rikenellaceae bacterium]